MGVALYLSKGKRIHYSSLLLFGRHVITVLIFFFQYLLLSLILLEITIFEDDVT
jgi:hypothetical protein